MTPPSTRTSRRRRKTRAKERASRYTSARKR
jgi:hypothetical protein